MKNAIDPQQIGQVLADWSLAHLPRMLLIVLVAFTVDRLGRRFLRRFQDRIEDQDTKAGRTGQRSATLASVLGTLLFFAVWALAFLQVLGELGLRLGPLIAGAGIVGAALGFGAQSLVRDFLTGFFVLLEDQYRVGDQIEVNGSLGRVERFTLRLTSMRSLDGSIHHISNGEIKKVINTSVGWSKAIVDIRAPQNEKLSDVTDALERAGEELAADHERSGLIMERPKILGVESFDPSHMDIRVTVTTPPGRHLSAARAYRDRVKEVFEQMGIDGKEAQPDVKPASDGVDASRGRQTARR